MPVLYPALLGPPLYANPTPASKWDLPMRSDCHRVYLARACAHRRLTVAWQTLDRRQNPVPLCTALQMDAERNGPAGGGACRADAVAVAISVAVISAIYASNYLPIYLVSWLKDYAGFSATPALCLAALAKAMQILGTFPAAYAGDRWGASGAVLVGGAATGALAVPALLSVRAALLWGSGGALYGTAFAVLGLVAPLPMTLYLVPSNLLMTSLFPAERRGRGVGLGLGLASVVGGATPLVCTVLARHNELLPGVFVLLLTIPSLATVAVARAAVRRGALPAYQRPWLF